MQKQKPWYLSKTIWLNLVGFLVPVISLVQQDSWVKNNPQFAMTLGTILAFCNLVLRVTAKSAITVNTKTDGKETQQ